MAFKKLVFYLYKTPISYC